MRFEEYVKECSDHRRKPDSCCKPKHSKHGKHYENCVEDVLEAILHAQKKAKEGSCQTSCQKSMDDLLGAKKVKKNTIPVLLYCGCHPYKGTGVTSYCSDYGHDKFKCVETFLFKVKELKRGCAVLELLVFKSDVKHGHCHKHDFSPCDQIDQKPVHDLIGTGICITVDLSCFCAVTCLPAVHL